MKDENKTKGQLINELAELRKQVVELKKGEAIPKGAEDALMESEEKLSQIVQGITVPTFVINNNHIVTYWNKACENLTGIIADKVIGTKKQWSAFYFVERPVMADIIMDAMPDEELSRYYGNKYQKSALIEEAYEAEDFFTDLGEGGKWLFFTATPLRDVEGNIIGAIETLQDITERKRAEEELIKQREHLDELVKERTADLQRMIDELKRAEKTLNRNFQQQRLLTEVSYLFTRLENFEKNMNNALYLIGEYTKVSRVYIFEDFNNGEFTKNTFEWCSENIEPQIDNLQQVPYKIVPSWKKILEKKGMVFSTNIFELPQDLIDILEPQKIKSIFVLPIYVKDQFFGFMGFDECVKNRIWDKSEIELLKTVVNIISNLFERKRAEEALQKSEEQFRLITENTSDVVTLNTFDLKASYTYVSPSIKAITGYEPEDLLGKSGFEFIHPEDKKKILFPLLKKYVNLKLKNLIAGKEFNFGETIEYRMKDKSGNWRYYQSTCNIVGNQLLFVSRDITERKQIDEKLAKIAAEQKNIMGTISDGIYMLDMKGNLVNWNREAEVVSGLSAEELTGKPIVELFAEQDRAAVADAIRKGLEEGIGEVTGSFLRKGRSPAIYQWSTVPLKDPQGKVIGLTGVGRDITECKQIEEKLAKIAAEQKNIMGTISDGIYMLDMSGNLVNWNKAAEIVSGLSAEELMDKPIVELFAEEDRTAVADAIRKGLEEGIGEVTGSFLRKGRSPAIYQWSTVPLKDPQGKVIGLTGVGRDITERKQIDEKLAKIAAEQKNIMGTISDGIYMLDMSGNLVNWNREAEVVSGLSAEELMDKPADELFAEEDRTAVAEAIRKGLEEGIGEVTGSFLRKGRSPAIYQWSTVPLKDPQGKVIGLTGVGRDITEQKRAEQQLKGLLKEKEVLVKEVYHRVKNNFSTMSSLIYLQSKQIKDKQALETFLHCRDRIKSMSLIHERLYQSKDLANINFAEYIKTLAVQLFRSYCTDPAKISLVTEFEDVLLGVDQAIPCGLIVNELITNSLKYAFPETWQGKGEIKIVLREKEDKKIELIVRDNGVGLPSKFDIEKSESLGLQLVNTLVDQLHGEMEIDRKKGTKVKISLARK